MYYFRCVHKNLQLVAFGSTTPMRCSHVALFTGESIGFVAIFGGLPAEATLNEAASSWLFVRMEVDIFELLHSCYSPIKA